MRLSKQREIADKSLGRVALLIYGTGLVIVLLSCCGLLVDLGLMELTKLQMQSAADAAAIGAALAVQVGNQASAGLLEAAQNGFTDGINGVTVSISSPPTSGSYADNVYGIQAVVTKQAKGIFFPTTLTLRVQSTALGIPAPCVYLLNQSSMQTTLNAVNETIQGNCPFYIGYSYFFNGGSSSTGSQFFVASSGATSTGSVSPNPIFGVPTVSDPLAYITNPMVGSCTYTDTSVTAQTTLQPGVYCGGLNINTTSTVTLNPGVYIVLGSLSINGPILNGTNVTFYVSQGHGYTAAPTIIQNVTATLSAPTTGTLQGILYYSDPAIPANQANLSMQNWNSSSVTDGIFYLRGQQLLLSNLNLRPKGYLGIVADTISVHNTGLHPAADYSSLAGGNPFHPASGSAGLVE